MCIFFTHTNNLENPRKFSFQKSPRLLEALELEIREKK